MEASRPVLSWKYHDAIYETLGTQVIVAVLAAFVMDRGVIAHVVGVAMLGFWLSAAVLMIRRPFAPTHYDLLFIQRGFWAVLAVATLRQIAS